MQEMHCRYTAPMADGCAHRWPRPPAEAARAARAVVLGVGIGREELGLAAGRAQPTITCDSGRNAYICMD